MKRLFFALPIPKDTRIRLDDYLEQYRKEPYFRNAKWVEQKNWHITTLFLGDVAEFRMEEIQTLARGLFANLTAFTLYFKDVSLFPRAQPKMIWLQVQESLEFQELTLETQKFIQPFLKKEESKKEIPHVTLARLKIPISSKGFSFKPCKLDALECKECHLYESILNPSGPVYTLIERFHFAQHDI